MPPRTLASLAHALTVTADNDGVVVALAEALSEVDRYAHLALVRFDERREMLGERIGVSGTQVTHTQLDTTFDHLPSPERSVIAAGGAHIGLPAGPGPH